MISRRRGKLLFAVVLPQVVEKLRVSSNQLGTLRKMLESKIELL